MTIAEMRMQQLKKAISCGSHDNNGNPPPMDSRYSWVIMFGSFLAHFVGLGILYSFGVFILPLTREFDVGRGTVAWIGSITAGVGLISGSASGMLSDRFGFQVVIGAGALLMACGLVVTSFMNVIWVFYFTYGILVGVGLGSFIPSIGAVGQWFHKYRGLATGLAVAGSGVGNLVLPPMLTSIIDSVGWRNGMRVLACFTVLTLVAAIVIRSRVPRHGKFEIGSFVKTRAFILLFTAGVFMGYGYLVPFVHIVPYAEDKGHSSFEASLLLSLMGGASMIGRIVLGILADKFGKVLLLRINFACMTVPTIIWPFIDNFWGLVFFSFVYGFFGGGFISMMPPVTAEYFGVAKLASILGLIYPASALGNILGPPITGILFDSTGSYTLGVELAAASMGMAFISLLFLPPVPQKESDPQPATEDLTQLGSPKESKATKPVKIHEEDEDSVSSSDTSDGDSGSSSGYIFGDP